MENQNQHTSSPTSGSQGNALDSLSVQAPIQSTTQPTYTPLASSPTTPVATPAMQPAPPQPRRSRKLPWKRIGLVLLVIALIAGAVLVGVRIFGSNGGSVLSQTTGSADKNFNTLDIPLQEFTSSGVLDSTKTLSINGQLKVNNSFVLAPTSKPTSGVAGQMYYDKDTNQLNYYNGTNFISLNNNPQTVTSINGTAGALTLGGGLTLSGGRLSNSGIVNITSASTNLTVSNDGNGTIILSSNGLQSTGGTTGRIPVFTGSQSLADSIISQSGSGIAINGGANISGTLNIQTSGTATVNLAELSSGVTGSIFNDGNLHVTGGSNNLWLDAGGSGTLFLNAGSSNPVAINESTIPAYPLEVNGDINITAGHAYRIGGTVICTIAGCTGGGGGGVSSLNGLSGALSVANASGSGTIITINDASTSQKGIAQFNSTNFAAASGVINTIQNINTTAAPTFGQLTLSSSQASAAMLTVNNTNLAATGNLIDLQLGGSSRFAVSPAGALTLSSTVNGQTISSAANLTGTLAVAGLASLNGGATVVGTLTANTISPTSALTVGSTTQSYTLQGNASSTLTATNAGNTTTLAFQAPTANVTYRFATTTAGTYDVCTTAGNCSGVGGGVTTPGGTTNKIAKFTGAQTIGDSLLTDNGTQVTIGGNLNVTGTTTLSTALTVTNGGTGATSLTANGVVIGNGTGALTSIAAGGAGQCLISTAGAPSWQTCPGSGGVASVNGLTGALTVANATAAGSTITINDATTSQKGIAQFNSTNFSVTGGIVNTIQDINTTAAPTFGQLTLTSSQSSAGMLTINNTNVSATGNLIDLQLNGASRFAVSPAGALTLSSTINGQTISSAANLTGTLAVAGLASLNGGATVTGTLTANTITPTSALTVGATTQSYTLQGNASSTLTATSAGNTTTIAFQNPTANVTYRFLTATAGTYDVCTTAGNCSGVGGGVTTPGGTANKVAKFSAAQTIVDSIITDNGSTVTIGGTLAVNTITPTAALTIGSTAQNLTLQGAGVSLSATNGGTTNTLTFATPSGSNKTITVPNASGTVAVSATGPISIDSSGNISCPTCVTSGGGVGAVDSVDGLTGALTIANSSGTGTTITINDASTAQKGIAQFNSTNFSVSSGTVNTIQNIDTTAAPQFGQLTLSSSQATAAMLTVNNTNPSGTGNLIDLQLNGASKFAVSPAGALTLSSTINGQTISSSANLTGTLAVAGLASLNGGATVTGTLTANTLTPSSSLTVGATGQSFTLQGNASSTITATNGGNTTSIAFQSPTASVTYRFLTATAGTYDVCTTAGNCSGVGGGVTTPGGTTNKIAKFTASQTIGDSIITDNGSTVTIGGTLAVNTITPSAAMTVGATGQNLTLQGATVNLTATSGGVTNSLTFATPASSNKTITIPNATGTVAVSASGPLALDANGNLTCPTCAISGSGVTSLNSLTGALSIANASGSGSTVTIDNASTSAKGIAQFNSTNFSAASGVINTIQDINTTAAPQFGQLTLSSSQATAAMLTVNNTNASGTGNLIDLQLNSSSKFSVAPNGNTTVAGTLTSGAINGQTISSAANFTGSVTVGSTLAVNTITPSATLTIGATSQALNLQGNASSTFAATNAGNTTTLAFQTPTANVTYRLLTAAAGTYDICTTAGNCTGTATTLQIAYNNGSSVTTTDARDLTFNLTDTSTDSNFLVNLQCATTCGSNGRFAIQNAGSDVLSVAPNSGAVLLKNSADSTSAFRVQNAAGTNVIQVDTTNQRVAIGNSAPALKFEVQGGDAAVYNSGNNARLVLGDSSTTGQYGWLQWDSANDYFRIETAGSNGLKINDNNVAIGNIFPDQPLKVGSGSTLLFQVSSTGAVQAQNSSNSTAALSVKNAAGYNLLTVDSSNSRTTIGNVTSTVGQGVAGTLRFADGTSTNRSSSLSTAALSADRSITLPDADGVVCLQSSSACGFALSSGAANYIQNQNSTDQSADFRISGTGRANTSIQTPLLDTAAAGTLNVGTTNATAISLNQNTTVASGKTLTVNGTALFKPNSNSTTSFQIQPAASTTPVFNVDTTNSRVSIGNAAPSYALDVTGDINSSTALRVGTTLVCDSTGCVAKSGSGFYIHNQITVQSANMFIQASDTSAPTAVFEQGASGTADVLDVLKNDGTTKYLSISSGGNFAVANGSTYSLNSGTSGSLASSGSITITAGGASTWSTSSGALTITAATNMTFNATGTLALGSSTTSTLNIGNASNNTRTISIGNAGTSATQTVTVGSQGGASILTLQGGTGNINLNGSASTIVKPSANSLTAFQVQPTASTTPVLDVDTTNSRVGINSNAPRTTLDVATDGAAVAIGNTSVGGSVVFGDAGTNNGLFYGSNTFTFRTSQSNGFQFYVDSDTDQATPEFTLADNGSALFRNDSNSTSAFQIQNTSSVNMFSVDTTNARLYVGPTAGDTVGTLLVLGNKTNAGDPTGVNGAMYYNSNSGRFRCYENSAWQNCLSRNDYTPAFIGYNAAPNSGSNLDVANRAWFIAVTVPVPVTVTGMRMDIDTPSGNMDVGLYDNSGTRLASSGSVAAPGSGQRSINFTSSASIQPGIYYLAISSNNTTLSISRFSDDSTVIGTNYFNSSFPLPSSVTLPGTNAGVASHGFALVGLVSGGVTQ